MYKSDWHIHSEASYDADLSIPYILERSEKYGITELGISDHVNIPNWITHLKKSQELFLKYKKPGFHLGVELTTQSKPKFDYIKAHGGSEELWKTCGPFEPFKGYELALTEEELRECGVEYVVAGAHWPCYAQYTREDLIKDYSLQNIYLASDKRVDIVAHPWWFDGKWANEKGVYDTLPWFDDFGVIPMSVHDEFAAAMIENDACMEWNILSFIVTNEYTEKFKKQYAEYVRMMFEKGVKITIGSDVHHDYPDMREEVEKLASYVGFKAEDFSKPKFRVY